MNLADMSWKDVASADIDVVLLPVGSTEQHGPHAPLGTDTLLANVVARGAAASSEHEVGVTPALPLGIAEEHRAFTGTLWVSPDTFRSVIRETVSSIAHHGWNRVIVVNGHGGNVDALREVCAEITRHRSISCRPFTWFESIELPPDADMGHGGAVETAALLASHPELIHSERLEAAAAEAAPRWGEWVAGVNLAVDSDEFTDNGVVGDPSLANQELGESVLNQATSSLIELIGVITERD